MMDVDRSLDPFFEETVRFGRLKKPTIIVVLAGISFSLPDIILFPLFGSEITTIQTAITTQIFVSILEPLAFWLLITAIFYIISQTSEQQTRFSDVLKTSGWGLAPLIGAGVVWTIGVFFGLQGATVPEPTGITTTLQEERALYRELLGQATSDPIFLVASALGIVLVLSCSVVLAYGIKHSCGFSKRRSFVISVVPVLLYAVLIGRRMLA